MRKESMIDASESVRRKKVRRTFLLLNCLFEFHAGITGATFVLFLYSKGLNTMEANLVVAMSLIVSLFYGDPDWRAGGFNWICQDECTQRNSDGCDQCAVFLL